MKNDLHIKIKIDSDNNELVVTQGELKKLGNVADTSSKGTDRLTSSLSSIAGTVGGIYAVTKAFDAIIAHGIDYNAQLETMQIGIASLISVNSSYETSTGRILGEQEKFTMAMASSADVVAMLKTANLETSATLTELTEGFQSAVGPALSAGLSLKQTVEYTKLMTQAAGAMGLPMNQLAQEMRSVVSGTIDMNSVVAKNIGITNEQIKTAKASGNLYEVLTEKLSGFATAGELVSNSYAGSMSNMSDAWDTMTGEITKPVFEKLSPEIQSIANLFNETAQAVHNFMVQFRSIGNLDQIEDLKRKMKSLAKQRADLKEQISYDSLSGTVINPNLQAWNQVNQELREAKTKIEEITKAQQEQLKVLHSPDPKHPTGTQPGVPKGLGATYNVDATEFYRRAKIQADALSLITPQLDKINNRYGAMYDVVKDLFSPQQLEDFYAVWGKEIDDISKKNEKAIDGVSKKTSKENEEVRGIFEDWSDQISKTLADGIQAGLDGTDFSDFAYSLTESIGNSMTQAGLNSISSTLTKSGTSWDDVSKGDWITTAIGIVLMGITSAQKKSAIAEQNLSNSMDRLTAVNKQLAEIGMGTGTQMNSTFGSLGSLISNLNAATGKLENFEPNLWQKANDKGASSVTDSIQGFLDDSGVTMFDSILSTQSVVQKKLDKYVRDWFGSDTDTDNIRTEVNNAKTALSEWSIEVSKSMDALISYGEQFGNMYDRLTGSNYFSDTAGKSALDSVTSTFGMDITSLTKLLGESFQISNIDELKAGLALGDQSKQNLEAMDKVSKLFKSIGISKFSAVDAIDMFDKIGTAVDYQIKLNKELADSYEKTNSAIEDALKALDSAYLGDYSPLSMLQKTDYANNVAYSTASSGSTSAIDAAYIALQTAAKSATRDEDITTEFRNYAKLLEGQVDDASRTDIVNAIITLTDKVKNLEDELAATREANAVA